MLNKRETEKLYNLIKYNKDNQKTDIASGDFCIEMLKRERKIIREFLIDINDGLCEESMDVLLAGWDKIFNLTVEKFKKFIDEEYAKRFTEQSQNDKIVMTKKQVKRLKELTLLDSDDTITMEQALELDRIERGMPGI